ncbi:MAG: class I SAM-dependent methyltransferase [Verrucomicrobiota bacterium]
MGNSQVTGRAAGTIDPASRGFNPGDPGRASAADAARAGRRPSGTCYSGFNVGGADWPRQELKDIQDPQERLRQLRQVGFKEARLVHESGGNLLRTFIAFCSMGVFEPWFHEFCYAEKEPICKLTPEVQLERLDRVAACLAEAEKAIPEGLNAARKPLNWGLYDAYYAGIQDFNKTLSDPAERIRVLLTLVEHPPRLLIECPSRAALGGRKYSFGTLWESYNRVLGLFVNRVLARYAFPGTESTQAIGGPVVTSFEFINEPDYTWLPDEQRIERSLNPQACACDKYLTELHLPQIPRHDLPNKPVRPAPWGFQEQDLDSAFAPDTPVLEFRWGAKFDLYVQCFADLHERLSREVADAMARAGVELDLVTGSVTHTNIDWLVRMHRANPDTFRHCNKIGIHPYHWPRHDIWDKTFVSKQDLSGWREANPRRFASEYCKQFNFLEQLAAFVKCGDGVSSHGLAGKGIWITEFGIGSKKLCPANHDARHNTRLFIYPRRERPPAEIVAAVWEDIYDAFLRQVDAEYLARNSVEALLFYTLREGFISHSSDDCHSNFSIYLSDGTPRLAEPTLSGLTGLLRSLARRETAKPMNTTLTESSPKTLEHFPGMTSVAERQYLRDYAENQFNGDGEIVDLGSWLGSLTVPLLQGLARNPRPGCPRKAVHAYDIFIWQKWMDPYQENPLIQGRYQDGDSFLPEFLRLVQPWDANRSLLVYAGDLCKIGWQGLPIELLVVDAMKAWELADYIVRNFYPHLIEGKSTVFHQDYCHFYEYWIHLIQYRLRNHFELIADLPASAGVVFKYTRRIDPAVLAQKWNDAAFTDEEVEAAFGYSLDIVKDRSKHVMLHAAKAFAYLSRNNPDQAQMTILSAISSGFRLEGELKTVSEMIAAKQAGREPGSVLQPASRNGQASRIPSRTAAVESPLERLIEQAATACQQGNLVQASQSFAAARMHPATRGADALALGHIALNIGDLPAAVDCFGKAIRLDPKESMTYASRALALQLMQRSEEAAKDAAQALQLNPSDLVALKVFARIQLNAGRAAEARDLCRKILALAPADPDAKVMAEEAGSLSGLDGVSPQQGSAAPAPSAPAALFGAPPSAPPPAPIPAEALLEPTDAQIGNVLDSFLARVGFRKLQKLGYHLQKNDYYSPLNDCDFLESNQDLWNRPDELSAIDWRLDDQLSVAREAARFVSELRDVPVTPPVDHSAYGWKNNFWENSDALVQYGLVRSRRPRRYVEVGCGWSSLLLKRALEHNAAEGRPAQVTLVEPYPNFAIFKHLPKDWEIHRTILQRTPFEVFERLEAGDVLFYDGSHCSKMASDVNWFFFKILPRLKPGVLIHIHDIFLPGEYPPPWVFERGQTWNEQYLLQAFLMHNSAYRILIANRYLFYKRQADLEQMFDRIQPVHGSSFWLEKTAAGIHGTQLNHASETFPTPARNGSASNGALSSVVQSAVQPGQLQSAIEQAVAACSAGDLATARTILDQVRSVKPGCCSEALTMGYVALNVGDTRLALSWFTAGVALDKTQAFAHSSRALALQLLQQTHEARRDAETALKLDPNDTVALKVLARISLNERRMAYAQAYCRRVLALDPQDPDCKRMMLESESAHTAVAAPELPPATQVWATPASIQPPARPVELSAGLKKLEGLAGDYATRTETWQSLGVEHLMQQLVVGEFQKPIEIFPHPAPVPAGKDGFPVPPPELTMGYGAGNTDIYLSCGRKSYEIITGLARKHQVELNAGDKVLDWGGAAGRVVRNFSEEAKRGVEVWGCDVHAPSIQWAQKHLSPPFRFFNSSCLPHLPFPENTFKFIYAFSVMTHLNTLRDLWLLELSRVLRPDGCCILTIHDENTWTWFRERGMPGWMPKELQSLPEMPGECVEIRGSRWEHCYTFFHSNYIRRNWGRYFEIQEIVPCADLYQAAVILKKRR